MCSVQLSHRITCQGAKYMPQRSNRYKIAVHSLCTFCHGLLQLWKSLWPSNCLLIHQKCNCKNQMGHKKLWAARWIRKCEHWKGRREANGAKHSSLSSVSLANKVFSPFYRLFAPRWAAGMRRLAFLWPGVLSPSQTIAILVTWPWRGVRQP